MGARDVGVPEAPGCARDSMCDDGLACTEDTCEGGECVHVPVAERCPTGTTCAAGLGCRPRRRCSTTAECVENNPCASAERCDPALGICLADLAPEGTLCGLGHTCRGGVCACSREQPLACGATCVDPRTDANHCGGCGRVCGASAWCADGRCVCSSPQIHCPQSGCTDTTADPSNCGACGNVCPRGDAGISTCIAGRCVAPCGSGTHACGPECLADTAPSSCGTACTPCPTPAHGVAGCTDGRCSLACVPGYHLCGGICAEDTSITACGATCAACVRPAHGEVACALGLCRITCNAGYHACGDRCAEDTSPASCGTACAPCPNPAHTTATCVRGACGFACEAGFSLCAGVCTDGTLPTACGVACTPCATPPHATATCVAGVCGSVCAAGYHRCAGECVADISPVSCGTSCTPCPETLGGVATCAAGACGVACVPGFRQVGLRCVELPRPISPASAADVTTRRPRVRWRTSTGLSEVFVDFCRDRGCSRLVETVTATGAETTPSGELPPGVVFWRVRRADGAGAGPTWSVVVGARSAAVQSAWGGLLDVNGDGYGDELVASTGDGDGRVYVFHGGSAGLEGLAAEVINSPTRGGDFGLASAGAGDVDGDGYPDVIVGTPRADDERGGAYLFAGGSMGLSPMAVATPTGPGTPGARFGAAVSAAGDLDGDGYGDVLVGAPGAAGGGRVYVFHGGRDGLGETARTVLIGPDGADGRFGISVAHAGDLDADGYADVVVGASGVDGETGRAYVFRGSSTGLTTTAAVVLGPVDGGLFGASVAGVGDVNGDGYSDVAVSAPAVGGNTGRVFVFLGRPEGVGATPSLRIDPPEGLFNDFGWAVASAGDFNGDGYADILVGAPRTSGYFGAAHVYVGGPTGPTSPPAASWLGGPAVGTLFGSTLAGGRDTDGDGFSDVAVGALYAHSFAGAVVVFRGNRAGTGSPMTLTIPVGSGGYFGRALARRGINGSGRAPVRPQGGGAERCPVHG